MKYLKLCNQFRNGEEPLELLMTLQQPEKRVAALLNLIERCCSPKYHEGAREQTLQEREALNGAAERYVYLLLAGASDLVVLPFLEGKQVNTNSFDGSISFQETDTLVQQILLEQARAAVAAYASLPGHAEQSMVHPWLRRFELVEARRLLLQTVVRGWAEAVDDKDSETFSKALVEAAAMPCDNNDAAKLVAEVMREVVVECEPRRIVDVLSTLDEEALVDPHRERLLGFIAPVLVIGLAKMSMKTTIHAKRAGYLLAHCIESTLSPAGWQAAQLNLRITAALDQLARTFLNSISDRSEFEGAGGNIDRIDSATGSIELSLRLGIYAPMDGAPLRERAFSIARAYSWIIFDDELYELVDPQVHLKVDFINRGTEQLDTRTSKVK